MAEKKMAQKIKSHDFWETYLASHEPLQSKITVRKLLVQTKPSPTQGLVKFPGIYTLIS